MSTNSAVLSPSGQSAFKDKAAMSESHDWLFRPPQSFVPVLQGLTDEQMPLVEEMRALLLAEGVATSTPSAQPM